MRRSLTVTFFVIVPKFQSPIHTCRRARVELGTITHDDPLSWRSRALANANANGASAALYVQTRGPFAFAMTPAWPWAATLTL